MFKIASALCALALTAATASAVVTDIQVVQTDNTVGGGGATGLTGWVTNDVLIDFTGQLTGVQILTSGLDAGDIFQHGSGGQTAPPAGFFGFSPSLEFDTFITLGAFNSENADATPSVAGGAVNIGGAPSATFNNQTIDIAYFPPGGTVISNRSDYPVARITLADTANGTLTLFAADEANSAPYVFAIVNGVVIPEPATLGLLGLGGLAMLRRRRLA